MRYNELYKLLRKVGCEIKRHGANHDIWQNTNNGKFTTVPRHSNEEVKIGTLKSIYKGLGIS